MTMTHMKNHTNNITTKGDTTNIIFCVEAFGDSTEELIEMSKFIKEMCRLGLTVHITSTEHGK